MTHLRQRICAAYDDVECPHSDHYPIDRDGNYVTVPCGECVAAAVIAVLAAPTKGQRERVDLLERRLVNTETARIEAVAAGNRKLHNDLANMNREAISEAAVNDLRSLVTRWMLKLGKTAAAQSVKDAAELPPGSVLGWGHNVLLKDTDNVWTWIGFEFDTKSTDAEVQPMMGGADVLRVGYSHEPGSC